MKLRPLNININPNQILGYCLLYDLSTFKVARDIHEWVDRTIPDDESIGKKNKLESYHMTLNYIGPLTQNQLNDLDKALEQLHIEPITVTFDKVGYFDEANVLYIGMKNKPPVALQRAFDDVNEILESLGIESEHNRFPKYKPHITLLHDCPVRPKFPTINRRFELTLLDVTMTQSIDKGDDEKIFLPIRWYPKSWYKYDYFGHGQRVGGFITTGELTNKEQLFYLSDIVSRYAKQKNIVASKSDYKVVTCPKERQDGRRVSWKPKTLEDFEDIKKLSKEQKRDIGLQIWGEYIEIDGKLYSIEGDYAISFDGKVGADRIDMNDIDDIETLSKHVLWLFPKEWYSSIPDGLEIVDINGKVEQFKKHETDNDARFGALAYGIMSKKE